MKNKNYFVAAIVGGIAFFFLGWLIYGVVLLDFMNANSGLPADVLSMVNKPEAEMIWWALVAGNLSSGFLLATILSWGQMNTAAAGAKAGATVGIFMSLGIDLMFYSMTNFFTTTSLFVDVMASVVMTTVGGALIGWMLGRGATKA